jgi:predicted porin
LVGYKNGPIDVVLTHQNTHNAAGTGATKVTLLGGNYDFGVAKAFLTFDSEKASPVFVTAAIPNTTDARNTVIGAKVPVGAGTVIVSYINHQNKAVTNADAHQFAVGYTYDLSKRTALYTSYGRLTNDTNSAIKAAAGKTDTLFNAGVRHSF